MQRSRSCGFNLSVEDGSPVDGAVVIQSKAITESRDCLGLAEGANMADQAEEVNTPAEDGDTAQQLQGTEVSEAEKNGEFSSSDGPDPGEKPSPASTEHSWTAPLLSFARKATETISSGVSYAATPRNPTPGSAASSPTNTLTENDLNYTLNQPGGFSSKTCKTWSYRSTFGTLTFMTSLHVT